MITIAPEDTKLARTVDHLYKGHLVNRVGWPLKRGLALWGGRDGGVL